jgi:hypothetical protein
MVILDFHIRTSIPASRKFEIVDMTSARPGLNDDGAVGYFLLYFIEDIL